MKKTKRIATVLLALVMVLSLSVCAFAAGTNSITVNGAQGGETYKIYKMLDLKVDLGKNAYSYTVNDKWNNFFTGEGAGAAYVTIDNGYVTWKDGKNSAADMEAFAKAAAEYASDNKVAADATQTPAADGSLVFGNLDAGYYLITSTNGTLAMVDTTPANPNPAVDEKNPNPTVDKQVKEDSTNEWGSSNSAQIGDTVYFRTSVTLMKGAKNYVVHDKMGDELTLNAGSITVVGLTKGTDYTVVTTGLTDGCDFEVRFTQDYLDTITASTTLDVTYNAVLNENAKVESAALNKTQLTWGDANHTEWDTTETNTYKFEVLKYAGADTAKNPLAGAVFQLKDASGKVVKLVKVSNTEYRVANGNEAGAVDSFTTVATGNIVIKGVDLDQYTLVEIEAPEGYNKLKDHVDVIVNAENALVVEVPNNTGAELPSTGGIGTTIFYVVGGILVVGAAVVLTTRKRMEKNAK
ncbi:MAG: SpaH/EbpB family LPXTG-anchored major pilin [Firmicutes bacterium]|nr:SpaH/EbpB family LPXTG-anchored major pilin [Bacillota bacterium]